MYRLYKFLTLLLEPFLWLYLRMRLHKGKEDGARIGERFGHASLARPKARLVWIHAASVGESLSVMPLIERLLVRYPTHQVLLTTVTVTAARLVESRLPVRAFHQYLPVDGLRPVRRFLRHWKPDLALWVESELWPNLMLETRRAGCPMLLLNARISERSYRQWQRYKQLAKLLLPCFELVLAQTGRAAQRFEKLGAPAVGFVGNLKYDAPPLPCPLPALETLTRAVGGRPLWLAASTHPGEEAVILGAHLRLKKQFPDLLTLIAPRHPADGERIRLMAASAGIPAIRRASKEVLTPETGLYIADTLGELGVFFTLSPIVFMGGSLIPRGGHNPLEPARMGCAILTGPYVHHFTEVFEELEQTGGLVRITADEAALAAAVSALLSSAPLREERIDAARKALSGHQGVLERVLDLLDPYLQSMR